MRFTAEITLRRTQDNEILEVFNVEHFIDEKNDPNYEKFLTLLSAHETYIEEGLEISYEGTLSVNGISKEVNKTFLHELYDALE